MSSPPPSSPTEPNTPGQIDRLPIAWQYTGNAAATPYDESIRRQIQEGFNHFELAFDAFQLAFNSHRAEIETQLNLIPKCYSECLSANTARKRNFDSLRDNANQNHEEFRLFRAESRDGQKKSKKRIIRMRQQAVTRLDALDEKIERIEERMENVESRIEHIDATLGTINENLVKLMSSLASPV